MNRQLWHGFAALTLVLFPLGSAPVLDTDGKVPDLKIEIVGFKDPNTQRVVLFRVTNVGPAWADHTTATIETVSPGPPNRVEVDVLDLSPKGEEEATKTPSQYEFEYRLAAACDGHVVKASLSAGKDWEGDRETNLGNNRLEQKVCEAKTQAAPKPETKPQAKPNEGSSQGAPIVVQPVDASTTITRGPSPAKTALEGASPQGAPIVQTVDPNTTGIGLRTNRPASVEAILGPEHLRPGKHELEFEPSIVRSLSRKTYRDPLAYSVDDTSDPEELFVGWDNRTYGPDFRLSQTAVNFDLAKLLEVSRPAVEEAHLSFVERPWEWGTPFGPRPDIPGCVTEIGNATNDWALPIREFATQDFMFRDKHLTFKTLPHTLSDVEVRTGQRWRAFDVTGHVQNQLQNPNDVALWFGYVLHGQVEDDRITHVDACLSMVYNLRLWVTYVVPSN